MRPAPCYQAGMAQVFVSYAQEDQEVAHRIAAFLEGQGISCWIAPRDVPPGQEYGAAILDAIEESGALLLVLSEDSNQSQFVHREVERAVSKAKPVLPVRIREVTPSGALEFFISSSQWVDAWRPPMEQHLLQLAGAVRALSGGASGQSGQSQGASEARPPAFRAAATPRRWIVAAALLVVAAAIGLVLWTPWQAAMPSAAQHLAGRWCQPMSGDAQAFYDFVALDDSHAAGEVSFSHATEIQRFEAAVTLGEPDLLTLTWTAPPDLVGSPPLVFRKEGDRRLVVVIEDLPEGTPPPEPLSRCEK